jgi:cell division protein FtsI/penicillin-binding protein 2
MREYRLRRRDLIRSICVTGSLKWSDVALRAAPDHFPGTALLLRLHGRKMLVETNAALADRWIVPPGSTIKPFSLLALLEGGKLRASDTFLCPRRMLIAGHNLTCSHPDTALPMNVSRAISYSCNCAVAHFARQFEPGELWRFLTRTGFGSTGTAEPASSLDDSVLEALGDDHIRVSAIEILHAYARLASLSTEPLASPIIEGLEGAVDFGTAQALKLRSTRVAGKTGTARVSPGGTAAWVAGFAPSRSPEVVFTVLVEGRSGGADAAPIAARMLQSYFGESG